MSGSTRSEYRKSEHIARSLPAPALDDAAPGDERAWCVERGAALVAMSADELLRAIGTGEISPRSRVWCEGLECWTRICDVPEIAVLFGGFEAELRSLPAVEIASPSSFAPPASTQASFDLSQLDTPSAVPVARPVRSSEGGGSRKKPTNSKVLPWGISLEFEGGDARWIGGGLCVAAAAIGVALFQTPASPSVAQAEHRLVAVETTAQAVAAALPPVMDRATLTRTEPGQRRQRGGAGRPQRR